MKAIQITTMKFLPGKMTEGIELLKKQAAIAARLGGPPWRSYRCISGGRDTMHTLLFRQRPNCGGNSWPYPNPHRYHGQARCSARASSPFTSRG